MFFMLHIVCHVLSILSFFLVCILPFFSLFSSPQCRTILDHEDMFQFLHITDSYLTTWTSVRQSTHLQYTCTHMQISAYLQIDEPSTFPTRPLAVTNISTQTCSQLQPAQICLYSFLASVSLAPAFFFLVFFQCIVFLCVLLESCYCSFLPCRLLFFIISLSVCVCSTRRFYVFAFYFLLLL